MADTIITALVAPPNIAHTLLANMDEATAQGVEQFTQLDKALEYADANPVQAFLCYGPILEKIGETRTWRRAIPAWPLVLVIDEKSERDTDKNLLGSVDDYINLSDIEPGSLSRIIQNAAGLHSLHGQFLQVLAENPDGVVIVNASGCVLYANRAATTLLGRKPEEVINEPFGVPIAVQEHTEINLPNGRAAEMRVVNIEWLGESALLANLRDITERKLAEAKLIQAAELDSLTALANRPHFQSELSKAISYASKQQTRVAVFFIDIDGFKAINDEMGHDAGDQLLRTIADRLTKSSREDTLVGRLGGDEFIALTRDAKAGAETMIAQRFLEELRHPVIINDQAFSISASIGVAVYPSDGHNAHALIMAADAAMYTAKNEGRNRVKLFSKEAGSASVRRKQLDNAMRLALTRKEMSLVYQPMFCIDREKPAIVATEALLRWTHPELGIVPPDEFIPLAESNGWIDAIGHWVIVEVCKQLSKWRLQPTSSEPALHCASINISTHQLKDPRFPEFMARIMRETSIEPERIWLEITETALMHNVDECIEVLTRVRALGLKIAIDDFGTGYSSLAYLQRLPIDVIKIDRAFIAGIGSHVGDTTIVSSVMQIAKSQDLQVVAEGVETPQELECLHKLGCGLVQGYLLARPMSAADLDNMLTQNNH